MPSVRLFVGNLPYQATEDDLRAHFSQVGAPTQIVRPLDRETGRARGFAFVEYADRAAAEEVIKRFDGQLFMGRPLAVSRQREFGLGAVDARFSVPPGQEVTVELRFDGVLQDRTGYRLDWYQQPTVSPDDVEVRVVLPPGRPVEAGPGVDLAGGVASVRDQRSRLDGSSDLAWR